MSRILNGNSHRRSWLCATVPSTFMHTKKINKKNNSISHPFLSITWLLSSNGFQLCSCSLSGHKVETRLRWSTDVVHCLFHNACSHASMTHIVCSDGASDGRCESLKWQEQNPVILLYWILYTVISGVKITECIYWSTYLSTHLSYVAYTFFFVSCCSTSLHWRGNECIFYSALFGVTMQIRILCTKHIIWCICIDPTLQRYIK